MKNVLLEKEKIFIGKFDLIHLRILHKKKLPGKMDEIFS